MGPLLLFRQKGEAKHAQAGQRGVEVHIEAKAEAGDSCLPPAERQTNCGTQLEHILVGAPQAGAEEHDP